MEAKSVVAIFLPFKNEALFLESCLSSISRQSFTHFTVYMVDDHSHDESPEIARKWMAQDKRFILFQNKGIGVIDAFKTVIPLISEPFFSRMDADDVMPERKLEILHAALEKAGPGHVLSGLVEYFPKDGVSPAYKRYEEWLNQICLQNTFTEHLFRECVVPACSWMMFSEEFKQNIPQNWKFPEDYHL
ncbi:MAG: glycosyltransferase family 2 protein, partial [Luteibaculum sp.]